jgi:hypothetical protein
MVVAIAALAVGWRAPAQAQPYILLSGTWALDINRDPFTRHFPATTYRRSGTILFKIESAPMGSKYISALTQNGFWLQIAKPVAGGPHIRPLSELSVNVPSDTVFIHQSIFCLSQTNRIIEPHEICDAGLPAANEKNIWTPIGEGWIFTFKESKKPSWLTLNTKLDEHTKQQLEDGGWDVSEAEFEV